MLKVVHSRSIEDSIGCLYNSAIFYWIFLSESLPYLVHAKMFPIRNGLLQLKNVHKLQLATRLQQQRTKSSLPMNTVICFVRQQVCSRWWNHFQCSSDEQFIQSNWVCLSLYRLIRMMQTNFLFIFVLLRKLGSLNEWVNFIKSYNLVLIYSYRSSTAYNMYKY